MAPTALADVRSEKVTNTSSAESSVLPPLNADVRLKKLWAQHGDPQSARYANPELTSLPSLVRFNARVRTKELAYLVPEGESFASITWKQFDCITDVAASYYATAFEREIEHGNKTSVQPTIALLGTGHTFQYWITQMALLKLGVRILLLSDKNADAARDHLLRSCNAVGVVAAQQFISHVKDNHLHAVQMQNFNAREIAESSTKFLRFETDDIWNQQILIIHSSGSTGLPKPIIHTNRSMMLIARMYRLFQSFIIENWYLCFPLFHIAGVSIMLGGLPSGATTTFPPELWPPAPGAILAAWRKLEQLDQSVDCLHCAPAVIEDIHEYLSLAGNDFSPLVNLKILQPGGAALSPALLEKLVKLRVNVKTTYGSTEIGPPYRTIPDVRENPNCYHIKNLFPNNPLTKMDPLGDGLFECVVYKGFELAAELWTDPQAPNPYRTNDLFIEVPPGSGSFVLQGRKDDVVNESTIIFLQPNESLPVTPKGNVRRKEAEKSYGDRVNALYSKLFDGVTESPEDVDVTQTSGIEFIRSSMASVCGVQSDQISDKATFYTLGLDSQKAVRLRSKLSRRFGKFPLMFIFEYPSVSLLSERLTQPVKRQELAPEGRHFKWIQDTVSRYSSEMESWVDLSKPSPPGGEAGKIVYLTGATGALGNALLATFAADVQVTKVYCAIRGTDAEARLSKSLNDRGYGAEVFGCDKFVAVPYDMSDPKLGLGEKAYDELAGEVTTVVHNAWKMDFNQQVDNFDHDCIKGTMSLLRFARSGIEKTFAFTSSVATNMGKSAISKTISETPISNDPALALETGYAQSKFIVELLTQTYSRTFNSPVRIFRVGQLCGHSTLGAWNKTEMFPIMIDTGLHHLRAMPTFASQSVNWLPVDICAGAISTVLASPATHDYTVHNLVNPSAISWYTFLDALETASETEFERVSMGEWVERLQRASEEGADIPGAKLLGFFEGMAQTEEGESTFDTSKTAALVPRLAACSAMDTELLTLYLCKWRETE
ncbi:hypothetical protein MBLNU459_g3943t1 [Dothideomycetes sp. NU459]